VIALCFLSLPNLFAQVSQHDDTCHDPLTVDQSQSEYYDTYGISLRTAANNEKLAQTFQPGVTKQITAVQLRLRRWDSPQGYIWVEIFATDSGVPTGTALTFGADNREARSAKIHTSDFTNHSFVNFVLPKGISLTASTTYAIVLCGDYAFNSETNVISWDYGTGNYYTNGAAYNYDSTNSSWSSLTPSSYDFSFKTYYGETNAFPLDQLLGAGKFDVGNIPEHTSGKHTISSGNITTGSSSFVDTGFSVTITTTGSTALVTFVGSIGISSPGSIYVDIILNDTTRVGNTTDGLLPLYIGTAGWTQNASFSVLVTGLTPGSNKFELQWKRNAGTATLYATSANAPTLSVIGF